MMDPKATARKYTAPMVKMAAGAAMLAGIDSFGPAEQDAMVAAVATFAGSGMVLWGMLQGLYRKFAAAWSAPK